MGKINKLQINSEKLMKNEELLTLKGGSYVDCPCGNGGQTWYCTVTWQGIYFYSGTACGSAEYIKKVYPESAGYSLECSGGSICHSIAI
jgi:hypothetical protein